MGTYLEIEFNCDADIHESDESMDYLQSLVEHYISDDEWEGLR